VAVPTLGQIKASGILQELISAYFSTDLRLVGSARPFHTEGHRKN
jgi:hypothetical protein